MKNKVIKPLTDEELLKKYGNGSTNKLVEAINKAIAFTSNKGRINSLSNK